MINLGEHVKKVIDSKRPSIKISQIADALHCRRGNVYDIFRRRNIDAELLYRLSVILEHDFFADLSKDLSENSL